MSFEKWFYTHLHFTVIDTSPGRRMRIMEDIKRAYDDAQPKWQPIETAPVGEWVLMLDGDRTMSRSDYDTPVYVDMIESGGRGQTVNAYIHNYTHWMPLPPPKGA